MGATYCLTARESWRTEKLPKLEVDGYVLGYVDNEKYENYFLKELIALFLNYIPDNIFQHGGAHPGGDGCSSSQCRA